MAKEMSGKTSERIEGLVAGVLTARDLAINVGSDAGVREGMKFRVMSDAPIDIRDPETDEVLGTFPREKVRVRATEVNPRFSVCRTYRVFRTGGGMLGRLAFMKSPPRQYPETLKAEDSEYLPELPEEESFVKKGDRVFQIMEEEDD